VYNTKSHDGKLNLPNYILADEDNAVYRKQLEDILSMGIRECTLLSIECSSDGAVVDYKRNCVRYKYLGVIRHASLLATNRNVAKVTYSQFVPNIEQYLEGID
jgi:hypothetical protein